jgi:hypothetical protein
VGPRAGYRGCRRGQRRRRRDHADHRGLHRRRPARRFRPGTLPAPAASLCPVRPAVGTPAPQPRPEGVQPPVARQLAQPWLQPVPPVRGRWPLARSLPGPGRPSPCRSGLPLPGPGPLDGPLRHGIRTFPSRGRGTYPRFWPLSRASARIRGFPPRLRALPGRAPPRLRHRSGRPSQQVQPVPARQCSSPPCRCPCRPAAPVPPFDLAPSRRPHRAPQQARCPATAPVPPLDLAPSSSPGRHAGHPAPPAPAPPAYLAPSPGRQFRGATAAGAQHRTAPPAPPVDLVPAPAAYRPRLRSQAARLASWPDAAGLVGTGRRPCCPGGPLACPQAAPLPGQGHACPPQGRVPAPAALVHPVARTAGQPPRAFPACPVPAVPGRRRRPRRVLGPVPAVPAAARPAHPLPRRHGLDAPADDPAPPGRALVGDPPAGAPGPGNRAATARAEAAVGSAACQCLGPPEPEPGPAETARPSGELAAQGTERADSRPAAGPDAAPRRTGPAAVA